MSEGRRADIEARVRRALEGSRVDEGAIGAVRDWIELVARWNQRIDLTAARDDDELVDLMLADAALFAAHIGDGARVVDVGSGAGAPGLALALLRPDLDVTLVEPLQKRVAFLRTALGTVAAGTSRIRVLRARGQAIPRSAGARPSYDVAVSRATLAPDAWLALGAELAVEVWILIAREPPPARTGWTAADDISYRWPLTGAERRALRFRRSPPSSSAHGGVGEQTDEAEQRRETERRRKKDEP